MRRRDVITLLAGGALAWPLAARTQPPGQLRRVGMLLGISDDDEGRLRVTAFRQRLRELGWVEGRNVAFDIRWTDGDPERRRASADALARSQLDVIVASSTPAVLALHSTRCTTPVIFAVVSDPVGDGLVADPARPDGNYTGFTNFELSMGGKWLEVLKEMIPSVATAGIVFDPANWPKSRPHYKPSLEAAAGVLGVKLIDVPIHTPDEIEGAVAGLAGERDVGVIVLPDNTTVRDRAVLARAIGQHRLPAIYPYRYFARSGGLASYGVDTVELFRRSAAYVDRLLNGWKLADLPVQSPTKFEFVLNLKAAKTLDLEFPASLIARADEVIE
jgi:putative ABC transport system substrate-binding protein